MTDDSTRRNGNGIGPFVTSDDSTRINEILTALADTHRRYVLYHLQNEKHASFTDTAQQVAAWKEECTLTDVPDESVNDLEIRLYHNHLPRLEEMNLIEYDNRSEQIRLRDLPDLAELCLEHCADRDLPG